MIANSSDSLSYPAILSRLGKRVFTRVSTLAAALLFVGVLSQTTHAQNPHKELHIAATADLQPVLAIITDRYEKATGVHITASFGSSATLMQQLMNGAPQDIFLSADFANPKKLQDAQLTDGDPLPYARGVLVLWARKDSPAQPIKLDSMFKPDVQKIAIANDLHAPYGMATRAALRNLHIESRVNSKLVVAENIMQTAQFAETGNAQAALISLTIANSAHFRELGTYDRLPEVYPPIRQCAVVMKNSSNRTAAHAFLQWLTTPEVQATLKSFGLDPAEQTPANSVAR